MTAPAGWYKVSEAAKALGVYDTVVDRMIRSGELTFIKDTLYRYIEPESLAAAIARRAGVADLAEALDLIARLRAENDQLAATANGAKSTRRMDAWEALSVLSLDEAMDLVSRIDTEDMTWREKTAIFAAERKIQRQIDTEERPKFVGKKPKGVGKDARRRTITTGIGLVDIWYWPNRNGWNSVCGGPRAPYPGGRTSHPSAAAAIKAAGYQARTMYGKPDRRSSARLRFLILERDAFTCRYCGRKAPNVELHVDHVIPVANNGSNGPENLVTACADCNLGKNKQMPREALSHDS